MATAANIVIADGQATPANVTFSPESVTPAESEFVDRSTGVSAFFRRLVLKYSRASAKRNTTRTTLAFAVPVTATVEGSPQVIRTLRANIEYILPDGTTDAERKDLHAFVVNGLGNTLVRGSMRDHDPVY